MLVSEKRDMNNFSLRFYRAYGVMLLCLFGLFMVFCCRFFGLVWWVCEFFWWCFVCVFCFVWLVFLFVQQEA